MDQYIQLTLDVDLLLPQERILVSDRPSNQFKGSKLYNQTQKLLLKSLKQLRRQNLQTIISIFSSNSKKILIRHTCFKKQKEMHLHLKCQQKWRKRKVIKETAKQINQGLQPQHHSSMEMQLNSNLRFLNKFSSQLLQRRLL